METMNDDPWNVAGTARDSDAAQKTMASQQNERQSRQVSRPASSGTATMILGIASIFLGGNVFAWPEVEESFSDMKFL